MTKYKIDINIEFEAKDFVNAEKVKGKIDECILPIFIGEKCLSSLEIILQKNEGEEKEEKENDTLQS